MKNTIITLIPAFAMYFMFGSGMIQAQTTSLDSILNVIKINNPELSMYDYRIKSFNEAARGAKSLMAPQIGGGLFMTPYNVTMWNGDEMNGSSGMGSFMISAQQMFTHKKKLNANADYMLGMAAVDSSMKNVMINEMYMMAKMNYYEWVVMKKKIVILKESEDLLNYLIKSTELKYTYGMDNLTAYYKAKAMLGEIQTMKLMTELEIEQKMNMLNTLMFRDPTIVFDIDTTFEIKNYENNKIDSAEIVSARSEFAMIGRKIDLLKSKQNLEYSKKYPDYGIKFDHMFPFGTAPQQFSLMFMVTLPVAPWSSKMYQSSIRSLDYEILSLNEQESSLKNMIAGNINSLKIQIRNKKKQLELTEKVIISSMKKNYETELLAYEQNTGMLFMVLDAWQNLNVSKLTYLDQLMDLLSLQVKYEKEMEVNND